MEARATPADDLLTALVDAEHEGERLNTDELVDQVRLLFIAGHETTVNLIGNGTLALLRNRSELERWQRDPSIGAAGRRRAAALRLPRAVLAPRDHVGSRPRRPRHRRGGHVRHPRARRRQPRSRALGRRRGHLDLTRPGAARHLSFGGGIHHCLGAALARLEGRVAIGTLLQRCPQVALAVDEPAWNGRMILRGLESLPVSLRG